VSPGLYRVQVIKWIDQASMRKATPDEYEASSSPLEVVVASGSQTLDLPLKRPTFSTPPPTGPVAAVPAGAKLPCSALTVSWSRSPNYKLSVTNNSGADLTQVDLTLQYRAASSNPPGGIDSSSPRSESLKLPVWRAGALWVQNLPLDVRPQSARLVGSVRTSGGEVQGVDCPVPDPR
jgi:hypothetical protein